MSKIKLSADVPCFVPTSQSNNASANSFQPDNRNLRQLSMRIPAYMTNCYPFVQEPPIYSNPPWQDAANSMNFAPVRRMVPYRSNHSYSPTPIATAKSKSFIHATKENESNVNKNFPQRRNRYNRPPTYEHFEKDIHSKISYVKKGSAKNHSGSKVPEKDCRVGDNIILDAPNPFQQKRSIQPHCSDVCNEGNPLKNTKTLKVQANAEISNNGITDQNFSKNKQSGSYSQRPDKLPRPFHPRKKSFNTSNSGFVAEKSEVSYKIPQEDSNSIVSKKLNKSDQKSSKMVLKNVKPDGRIEKTYPNVNSSKKGKVSVVSADNVRDIKSTSNSSVKVLSSQLHQQPVVVSSCDEEGYPTLESVYKKTPKFLKIEIHQDQDNDTSNFNHKQESTIDSNVWNKSKSGLSFSDVLKSIPKKPATSSSTSSNDTQIKDKKPASKAKPEKIPKKKKPVKVIKKTKPKARSAIQFNLGGVLDRIQEEKDIQRQIKEKEGVKVGVRKPKTNEVRFLAKKENVKSLNVHSSSHHNVLDSSAPRKRGKERERPKKKKSSPLKRAILSDRAARQLKKDMDLSSQNISTELNDSYKEQEIPEPSNNVPVSNLALKFVERKVISPEAKALIHSRRFREYCDHYLAPEIDKAVEMLISDLVRFQDRLYHQNPVKAKAKRRITLGLREVTKHVKNGKIKCLIIAPNLEKSTAKGGLDDTLHTLIDVASERNIPLVFALNKRRLGSLCMKIVGVSCVGIFNYDGSEENFKKIVQLSTESRDLYQKNISSLEADLAELNLVGDENKAPRMSHLTHLKSMYSTSTQVTSYRMAEPLLQQKENQSQS